MTFRFAALIAASLVMGCTTAQPRATAGTDVVIADPPRHPSHPARNRQLVIPSGPTHPALGRSAEMNALFLLAAGEGPKPTLLLLHGLPGNERNLDLAQAIRRAGWNVLTFTYRGAWGSEGIFSTQHAVADTEAALAFLRSEDAARDYGIDSSRIVLAGHSMGGYMAAHVSARDHGGGGPIESIGDGHGAGATIIRRWRMPPIAGVILLDAWDIAASARELKAGGAEARAAFIAGVDDLGRALGPITAADLADNLIRRGEEWDLAALAGPLARRRVLTVYATHGGAEENRAFARMLASACAGRADAPCRTLTAVELATDHAFADHRIALAQLVVRWLEALDR